MIITATQGDIFEAFYKTSEFVFPKFIFSEFAFLKTSISLHPRGSNERAEHPSFPSRGQTTNAKLHPTVFSTLQKSTAQQRA